MPTTPQAAATLDADCAAATLAAAARLRPAVVAIDGPAASGKSTVGYALAGLIHYLYFDTGLMYRGITRLALDAGLATGDEARVSALAETTQLDVLPPGPKHADGRLCTVMVGATDITPYLRTPDVDRQVSAVSAMSRVRRALSDQQRRIALAYGNGRGDLAGVVMVGRDIGTVVMPDAPVKLYMDASTEARAGRRYQELVAAGQSVAWEAVLADMKRRDELDSSRRHAPLAVAADAIRLDTSPMSVREVVCAIAEIIQAVVRDAQEPE